MLEHVQELLPPAGEYGKDAPKRNVVAADGRVFEQFQAYRELLRDGIKDILGEATAASFVLKVGADLHTCLHAYLRECANEIHGACMTKVQSW